jgi:UDP-N-acetyl-D-mannosaminuronic acid dehydrogenase
MAFERICILGMGYIGLPTAAVFASRGINVVGVDVNPSVVNTINLGKLHIVEPQLDVVLKKAVDSKYLKAYTEPQPADAFIIAVPTPLGTNKEPDISYIKHAVEALAPYLVRGNLVVLESTSPVGTTAELCNWLTKARPDLTFPTKHGDDSDIRVAYCPERVLPGQILRELIENDRIIGGITPTCAKLAANLYKMIIKSRCVETEAGLAEMAKLTENAFRDVNIAFANELSTICDKLELDVWELIKLTNHHPRVNILQPGVGVGGHCIAVDPWFIVSSASSEATIIRTAREINDNKPSFVVNKAQTTINSNGWRKIGCLGLAFKPNVDDTRGSPAVDVVVRLAEQQNIELLVVEPFIDILPDSLSSCQNVRHVSLEQAAKISDGFLGLVRHDQFVDFFAENNAGTEKLLDFVNLHPKS